MEVPRTDLCDILIEHISIMQRDTTNTPDDRAFLGTCAAVLDKTLSS
jgi:hypothetical protein